MSTTVTASDVANALNYLLAARALTVVDNQAQVWWDYLTHEVDHLQASELAPACRRVIRDWAGERRTWQVDVARYATAVKVLRREHLDAATKGQGLPVPAGLGDEPVLEARWRQAWARHVQAGASVEQAERAAWGEVGRQPPPPAIGPAGPSGAAAARAVIEGLARNHTTN